MSTAHRIVFGTVLILAATSVVGAEDIAVDWKPELQRFLDRAVDQLEVPGAVVVAVSRTEGSTVLTSGVRCLDGEDPVTPSTSFGIGSLSKAFTATAAASLVGDGATHWDVRVRTVIPELDLGDPMLNDRLTLRDLLAHRSGLANHNLLHFNIEAGTAWILPRLRLMEPAGDFRDRFIYSSLGYILAGEVIGRLAGSPWDKVVERKLLEPLGMGSTTAGPPPETGPPAACGYLRWAGSTEDLAPVSLTVAAPAMGLYSTGSDYARWFEFLLGDGEYRGRKVVDAKALQETWTPQLAMRRRGPELQAYGFGWHLSSWRGQPLLSHNGGGTGFTSSNRIYPEAGVAIAVFANRSVSALPDVVAERASELILRERLSDGLLDRAAAMSARVESLQDSTAEALMSTRDADSPPSLELAAYAGCYEHPVFGRLQVRVDDSLITASFHGVGHTVQHLHDEVFMLSSAYTGDNQATFAIDEGTVSSVSIALGSPAEERLFIRSADSCSSDQA